MMAFAMETYGGIGEEGRLVLKMLAAHSTEMSPEQFFQHALHRLSITLQTANANVALQSMQRLQLTQYLRGQRGQLWYRKHVLPAEPISAERLAGRLFPIDVEASDTFDHAAPACFDHTTRMATAHATRHAGCGHRSNLGYTRPTAACA